MTESFIDSPRAVHGDEGCCRGDKDDLKAGAYIYLSQPPSTLQVFIKRVIKLPQLQNTRNDESIWLNYLYMSYQSRPHIKILILW